MAYQARFKRYEIKYMLTADQKSRVLGAMEPYMTLDRYGRGTIRNVYFDTDDFRLIRRSVEKPVYKEKLRIRSYAKVEPEQPVLVELKKKYRSVVYKRRLSMEEGKAMEWLRWESGEGPEGQIAREIEYFRQFYRGLHPAVFLSYDREAYCDRAGGDFRVTFDRNVLCRREALSLGEEVWGQPILSPEQVLMEVKCSGGIPLWMTRILSEEHIYKTPFSKYGRAYETLIYPTLKPGGALYV